MNIDVKKLAIYYGIPSLINNSTNVNEAISEFNNYDIVVLGEGLEDINHPDHSNTLQIISQSTADFYGYVNCNQKNNKVYLAIDNWCNMGVIGIFADQLGFEFRVKRSTQNQFIDYIHYRELVVFANVWNPEDLFGNDFHMMNRHQEETHMTSNDWYLAQSFYYYADFDIPNDDQYSNIWKLRADVINGYKEQIGFKVATTTTTSYSIYNFQQYKLDEAFYASAMCNFDAFSFGEKYFSAQDSLLPFRQRPSYLGTKLKGEIQQMNDIYYRNVNIGLSIDTINHTVRILTE